MTWRLFGEHGTELRLLRDAESVIWGRSISPCALDNTFLPNVTEQQLKAALLLNIIIHADAQKWQFCPLSLEVIPLPAMESGKSPQSSMSSVLPPHFSTGLYIPISQDT